MSLVREALDKAEREAAARAARERGLPEKLSAAGQPYRAPRARLRAAPLLALLLGVAALGAGAAYVLRLPSDPIQEEPLSTQEQQGGAAAPSAEQKISVKGKNEENSSSGLPAEAGTATPLPAGAASSATLETAPEAPTTAGAHLSMQKNVLATETPAGQRPSEVKKEKNGQPEPERFVREALLDGGATRIALGGIAWSEAAPLAYLNGKLRGVGESVAGLEIRAIEREQVVLSTRDRTIVLALR